MFGRGSRDAKRGEKLVRPAKGQQGVALSFNHAYRGLIYAVRTQRNMRFHVVASAAVMAVFVTEMFNTALEFTVDLVTNEYHPLAKLAKDVSAGAVLVTSVAALAVGYLLLSDNLGPFSLETLERVRNWPGHVTLVALVLVTIAVLLGKALTRAPNNFLGGMPSGHAAVSFAGWVAASFVASEGRFAGLVSLITLLMALLVCQSRVEAGIHTYYEVAAGALIGTLLAITVFQLL